ncbi:hypothetical protein [Paraburkholderia susongensis]|uniref:Uncharacterized protein n=1 Tax=Paraburkholderia susongensis TaxID=1515439 RepID=A0A1X7KUD7_9BURK|nr:hypothetical protein [Paraburkholderia susongensis]SMG45138.1 hypothetical protein SAMN06265784_104342 [Paraburkholderia susongensis]
MIDTQREIERRLSVLRGLKLSGVNHAADMLTMGFGLLRQVTNFKGKVKYVGEWALHVQCTWQLERAGVVVATRDDLCGPDEKAHATANRLQEMLIERGTFIVESLTADETDGVVLTLSGDLRFIVIPDGIEEDEDWRFFAPGVDAAHLVIEGGTVAIESFD